MTGRARSRPATRNITATNRRCFSISSRRGWPTASESWVNWDPVDHTVLANEQVIDGRGWRTGALVEKRLLSQWFLRITEFSEELLDAIKTLDRWPERVRLMQENWIGRSEGARVVVADCRTRTTRSRSSRPGPDTLFGASFLALSPHHPLAQRLAASDPELAEFIAECDRLGTSEAVIEAAEKRGYRTPLEAVHPFDETRRVPVYVANFVLMEYGTGAIFGCPAHDQRDLDFARKYGLPVIPVILPPGEDPATFQVGDTAYVEDGVAFNSDFLDGLSVAEAKRAAGERLEQLGRGERTIAYRLRDWGVSRQRYWGCPIPVIHCPDCGIVPVPEDDLPVELPQDVSFDKPGNPLDHHPTWKHVDLPVLQQPGRRARPTRSTRSSNRPGISCASARRARRSRSTARRPNTGCRSTSISAASSTPSCTCSIRASSPARLKRCGYIDLDEPFAGLFTQGMVLHQTYQNGAGEWLFPKEVDATADGALTDAAGRPVTVGRLEKMSKSKKNVVDLDDIVDSYGADTARLYLLSDSPPERDLEWTEAGIDGAWRYVSRLWRLVSEPAVALPPAGKRDAAGPVAGPRRAAPHDPQDDRGGHRRSRQIPLQPRRRAHPRADQRAGGHVRRAEPGAGAVLREGLEVVDTAGRADDAASRRGDVADARATRR